MLGSMASCPAASAACRIACLRRSVLEKWSHCDHEGLNGQCCADEIAHQHAAEIENDAVHNPNPAGITHTLFALFRRHHLDFSTYWAMASPPLRSADPGNAAALPLPHVQRGCHQAPDHSRLWPKRRCRVSTASKPLRLKTRTPAPILPASAGSRRGG
jgi:hypothetical protein